MSSNKNTPPQDVREAATYAECNPPSKCEHKWDGPFRAFLDGNGGEATCSKCGRGAFNMWEIWE